MFITINLILTLIIALSTAIAAYFAKKSISISSKSIKLQSNALYSQVILDLLNEYSSSEKSEAIQRLVKWKKTHKDNYAIKYSELKKKDDPAGKKLDDARRCLSHYFAKVRILLEAEVLPENIIKRIITQDQFDLLFNILVPLEEVAVENEKYNPLTFDVFKRLSY